MDPLKISKRRNIHKAGLVWCHFEEDTRKAIWKTLRSDFTLPDGCQWSLHDAVMAGPRLSLLTRGLLRFSSHVRYSPLMEGVYIVVFVASHGKRQTSNVLFDVADEGDFALATAALSSQRSDGAIEFPEITARSGRPQYLRDVSTSVSAFESEGDYPASSHSTTGASPPRMIPQSRHERGRSGSLKSDGMDSGDQSDESLDDDELYDQLLRKFTGRGMRERESGDELSDEHVEKSTNGQVDGNGDEDGTGHVSSHVEGEGQGH